MIPKKILYFDCSSGICGNMVLGALLEITGDKESFFKEINKLNLSGYEINVFESESYGIGGTYVDVVVDGEDEYGRTHHLKGEHHHHHRNLNDINKIIDDSSLEENTKKLAQKIFLKIAESESRVHRKSLDEVHFHEVGAIDSIIDIVGAAILINQISPDKIISSIVNEGHGSITCAHGKMSVPVPATSDIFAKAKVKFRQVDIDTELVTPTGAAIIATIAEEYGMMPELTLEKVGFGLGSRDLGCPNVLKVYYGETKDVKSDIYIIESNIDDSSGELLGYCMEKLLENGAKDVSFTPIFMKKNRPAYKLEVICDRTDVDKLSDIIFEETTTIGIRFYPVERTELKREIITINTKYGEVIAKKVITPSGKVYIYPEYESAKELSIKKHVPIKEIYNIIK